MRRGTEAADVISGGAWECTKQNGERGNPTLTKHLRSAASRALIARVWRRSGHAFARMGHATRPSLGSNPDCFRGYVPDRACCCNTAWPHPTWARRSSQTRTATKPLPTKPCNLLWQTASSLVTCLYGACCQGSRRRAGGRRHVDSAPHQQYVYFRFGSEDTTILASGSPGFVKKRRDGGESQILPRHIWSIKHKMR